jgi:hypothetical protein
MQMYAYKKGPQIAPLADTVVNERSEMLHL